MEVEEVALLTECVDRNITNRINVAISFAVALLTECVDRNIQLPYGFIWSYWSHSLRSAWIEICNCGTVTGLPVGRTPYGVRG